MACLDKGVVACLYEFAMACLDTNNNKDDFDVDIRHSFDDCFEYFSLHTPCNTFLSETWVDNI